MMITKKEKINDLYSKVTEWAKSKGIDKQLPKDGLSKVGEESGEVIDALFANDRTAMEDAIGDLLVTIVNFGNELNLKGNEIIEEGLHRGAILNGFKRDPLEKKIAENAIHRIFQDNGEQIHTQAFQVLSICSSIQQISSLLIRDNEKQTNLEQIRTLLVQIVMHVEILAPEFDLEPLDCLEEAYNVIKGRTGKIVNGVFVKDADLKNKKDNQE